MSLLINNWKEILLAFIFLLLVFISGIMIANEHNKVKVLQSIERTSLHEIDSLNTDLKGANKQISNLRDSMSYYIGQANMESSQSKVVYVQVKNKKDEITKKVNDVNYLSHDSISRLFSIYSARHRATYSTQR